MNYNKPKGKARYQVPQRGAYRTAEYYLTPELEKVFRKKFPVTPNRNMMKLFGISFRTLMRFRKELGLSKTVSPITIMKRRDRARYDKMCEEHRSRRLELEHYIRKRLRWGMDNPTRLHRPNFVFTKSQYNIRYNMSRHGYILGDMSDNSGERYTICYDSNTIRSDIMERNAVRHGFTIKSHDKRAGKTSSHSITHVNHFGS